MGIFVHFSIANSNQVQQCTFIYSVWLIAHIDHDCIPLKFPLVQWLEHPTSLRTVVDSNLICELIIFSWVLLSLHMLVLVSFMKSMQHPLRPCNCVYMWWLALILVKLKFARRRKCLGIQWPILRLQLVWALESDRRNCYLAPSVNKHKLIDQLLPSIWRAFIWSHLILEQAGLHDGIIWLQLRSGLY